MPKRQKTSSECIQDYLISKIETSGKLFWKKSWKDDPAAGTPMNMISGKAYRGINMLTLDGHDTPFWLSARQIYEAGGKLLPDQDYSIAVYWKQFTLRSKDADTPDEDGTGRSFMKPFYHRVYNLAQTEGLKAPKALKRKRVNRKKVCEDIVKRYPAPPKIVDGKPSNRAFYRSSEDLVNMPMISQFDSADEYYATLFHELGHSTGHESRLKRDLGNVFGSHDYGREELVAEFTACFLCGEAGINTTMDNSAAYLQGWLSAVKDDPKMLLWAASRAQKASDLILNVEPVAYDKAA